MHMCLVACVSALSQLAALSTAFPPHMAASLVLPLLLALLRDRVACVRHSTAVQVRVELYLFTCLVLSSVLPVIVLLSAHFLLLSRVH